MSKSTKGSLKGTTVYEIGKTIQRTDGQGKVSKNSPTIVEGLKVKKPSYEEGLHIYGPSELASMKVPKQEVIGDKIHGFQREVKRQHIRKIANAMLSGKVMPTVEAGLYNNTAWIVDGQQRAIAAIIAGAQLPVNIRKLSEEEMHQLFADSAKGIKINPSIIVLAANDPFSEYVQDAVTNPKHPWGSLVTHRATSDKRMTPKQMFDSVASYVSNTLASQGSSLAKSVGETYTFEEDKADELAKLFTAFGTKKTNPLAYRPIAIRAITYVAVLVVRRQGSKAADIKRWIDWMPKFPFEQYMGIRRSKELAYTMILHWNKRLSAENKLSLPDELI